MPPRTLLGLMLAVVGLSASVAANPTVLKNTRELFVDDYILEKNVGLESRLGTVTNAGTALLLNQPWEGRSSGAFISVFHNGEKYQMYYRGGFGQSERKDLTCYAESADGITWVRPKLGLFEVAGTKENNVVLPPGEPFFAGHNLSVYYDNRPGVPAEERYKAVGGGMGSSKAHRAAGTTRALYRYVSADGQKWKLYSPEPLFAPYALDSQNVLVWLPAEQCFAVYMRVWSLDVPGQPIRYHHIPNNIRLIARSTAKEFGGPWTAPVTMTTGNVPLEDLYTNATQPYFRAPHILIAMPFRFVPGRVVLSPEQFKQYDMKPNLGVSDIILMSSRGGTSYDRKFMESFFRPGMDESSWGTRSNIPGTGIVQTGPAEMSFYVMRGYLSNKVRIERLTLRLDGFASLHAGYKTGYAITRPLQLDGKRLSLNVSTSARGSIKVVVLDENSAELPGFGEADARELVGDTIDLTATWKDHATLEGLSGKVVRLKFIIQDADLFSFGVFDR